MHIKNRNGLAGWRKKNRPASVGAATGRPQSPASVAASAADSSVGAPTGRPQSASTAPASVGAPTGRPQSDLEKLYSAIMTREGFSYDAASDPAYQQYRDSYVSSGKRAMADASDRAAALTGGYGSTYSAAVGQQEYDEYMKKLADAVPELESAAYDRYAAEGDALYDRYALAKAADDEAYSREQDAAKLAAAEREYNQKLAAAEYERAAAEAKEAHTKQKDERTMLTALVGKGYDPTDAELSSAGMTRAQANALLYEYYRSSKQSAPAWLTDALGIAPAAATAYTTGSSALSKVKSMVKELKNAGADDETVNTYISRQATAGLITVADARKLMSIGNK